MRILSNTVGTIALLVCGLIATVYVIVFSIAHNFLITALQIFKLWQGK